MRLKTHSQPAQPPPPERREARYLPSEPSVVAAPNAGANEMCAPAAPEVSWPSWVELLPPPDAQGRGVGRDGRWWYAPRDYHAFAAHMFAREPRVLVDVDRQSMIIGRLPGTPESTSAAGRAATEWTAGRHRHWACTNWRMPRRIL